MGNNRTISTIILSIAIIIATLIAVYTVNSYWEKRLAIDAKQGCVEAAASSDPAGGFNGAVYQICIKDKGYETSLR